MNTFPFISAVEASAKRVLDAWSQSGYEFEKLPSLASAELYASQFQTLFDEDAFIDWICKSSCLPEQLDPQSSFGDPPVTTWSNENLIVDVYFWRLSHTNLHDHGFAGAFVNLVGDSLQVEYDFDIQTNHSKHIDLGKLSIKTIRYIPAGQVQPIQPGPSFLHRIWHLHLPTITMVMRSRRGPQQHDYFLPGARISGGLKPTIETQRRREIVRYLFPRQHPNTARIVEQVAIDAAPEEALFLLYTLYTDLQSGERKQIFQGLVDKLATMHGGWVRSALEARDPTLLLKTVAQKRFSSVEERILFALLCTFDTRAEIEEWVRRLMNPQDGRETIISLLTNMINSHAIITQTASVDSGILEAMIRAESEENALALLHESHKITPRQNKQLKVLVTDLWRNPVLMPMFEG